MKAITIKQPWASLIVEGIKDIENRTWPTKFRGRVLIHAADKGWKWQAVLNYLSDKAKAILNSFGYDALWLHRLPTSAIIGSVEIADCVINHSSVWAEKGFAFTGYDKNGDPKDRQIFNWVLANPIIFPEPIPCKGKLSFWEYEFDEGTYECTNQNSYTYQSSGERQGCIQNCDECYYFKSKHEN